MDEGMMRKKHTTEQIIDILTEIEGRRSKGEAIGMICQSLNISQRNYHRWLCDYGGIMWIKVLSD